jgi:transposase
VRRSHRERNRLIAERTAHVNRIKGLLFAQGIRGINVKARCKTLRIDKLVTGEGRPLPPRLDQEIKREIERLGLVQQQIAAIEEERDKSPTTWQAGSGPVRATTIQMAWLWIKHQPKSAIAQWFVQRTDGQSGRIKRIMIVAVARKLAIALWRYLEQGLVPQGAILTR